MTVETDLIKNSDGTFSVFTAPVSAAGAFVAVAPRSSSRTPDHQRPPRSLRPGKGHRRTVATS